MNKSRIYESLPAVFLAGTIGMFAVTACGSKTETQTSKPAPAATRPYQPATTTSEVTTTESSTSTTYPGDVRLGPATAECNVNGVAVPTTPEQYPGPCYETVPNPVATTTSIEIQSPEQG